MPLRLPRLIPTPLLLVVTGPPPHTTFTLVWLPQRLWLDYVYRHTTRWWIWSLILTVDTVYNYMPRYPRSPLHYVVVVTLYMDTPGHWTLVTVGYLAGPGCPFYPDSPTICTLPFTLCYCVTLLR